MMSEFGGALQSLSPALWQVEQVIILDWYDGPRTGFCKMIQPEVSFYFEVLADSYSEDDTDDHLYELSFCLSETFDKVADIFARVDQIKKPIWIPSGNTDLRAEDEQELDEIVSNAKPSSIVVQSRNMTKFSCCWVKSRRN